MRRWLEQYAKERDQRSNAFVAKLKDMADNPQEKGETISFPRISENYKEKQVSGARCTVCGEKDESVMKTAILRKYMKLQVYYRDLKETTGGKIPVTEQYYCKGRNAVLTELMEEFGLRKDVRKPLRTPFRGVN